MLHHVPDIGGQKHLRCDAQFGCAAIAVCLHFAVKQSEEPMIRKNTYTCRFARRVLMAGMAAGLMAASGSNASAAVFQLTYAGTFNTDDALDLASGTTPAHFAAVTPFTLVATFDTNSTNHVGMLPFPGFVAYSPMKAILMVGSESFLRRLLRG
jgi:hypothetical protein